MIYEYALEPAVVAKWGDRLYFQYFIEAFSAGTPRRFACFPSRFQDWSREVIAIARGLGVSAEDRKRLEALLRKLNTANNKVIRPNRVLTTGDWSADIISEHTVLPYHAISISDPGVEEDYIIPGEMVDIMVHDKWDMDNAITVRRTENELGRSLHNMLRFSSRIVFVDPFFGASSDFEKAFKKFFELMVKDRFSTNLPKVEILTKYNPTPSDEAYEISCKSQHSSNIPTGIEVVVRRLKDIDGTGVKIHDRYLLTSLGCIESTYGFGADPDSETRLSILSEADHKKKWHDYVQNRQFDEIFSFRLDS